MPPESLRSIAALQSASKATQGPRHLAQLLHRRTAALLRLQASLRRFVGQREMLVHLVAQIESPESSRPSTLRGIRDREAQARFLGAWETAVGRFERDWEEGMVNFVTWDVSPSSHEIAPLTEPEREFLELLVSDPYALGAGIATLEGEAVTSLLPAPSCPSTHLTVLLHLCASAVGSEAVLLLLSGICETGLRELIGRESSRRRGSTRATAEGARERELTGFLNGVLEMADSMGLEIMSDSIGPLSFHGGHEAILVSLLHQSRSSPFVPSTMTAPAPPPIRPATSPPTWGSSAIHTISSLSAYSTAGIYNVASTAANVFLPPSPTSSTSPSPTPDSQPLARSATATPSIPSRLVEKAESTWTPLDAALHRAAIALLSLSTPVRSATASPRPLVEVLLGQLGDTFPLVKDPAGHRKFLSVALVRWWGFTWLAGKFGKVGAGGGYVTSAMTYGVELGGTALGTGGGSGGKAVLEGVCVEARETVEILLPLQRIIYLAIVEESGLGGAEPWDGRLLDGDAERGELRVAAKTFLRSSWNRSVVPHPSLRQAAFLISPADIASLRVAFSALVQPREVQERQPSSPISFKRKSGTEGSSGSDMSDRPPVPSTSLTLVVASSAPGVKTRMQSGAEAIDGHDSGDLATASPIQGSLGEAQMRICVRAMLALVAMGQVEENFSASLLSASQAATESRDFTTALLLSQAHTIMDIATPLDISSVLDSIAHPLRQEHELELRRLQAIQDRLARLEVLRGALLESARAARGRADELCMRAWFISLRTGPTLTQLRKGLKELATPRVDLEDCRAHLEVVNGWMKKHGMHDFLRAGSDGETHMEALMLVRVATDELCQEESAYSSPMWRREKDLMQMHREEEEESKRGVKEESWPESLYGAASSILYVVPGVASTPSPPPPPPPSASASRAKHVLLSFGASSPSFCSTDDTPSHPLAGAVHHSAALRSKLTGFVWSHVLALRLVPLSCRGVEEEGHALGCDGWIEELSGERSLLERIGPGKVGEGAVKVFHPSSASQPPSVTAREHHQVLLDRFIQHPAPEQKLQAIWELEMVLAAELSFPTSLPRQSPITTTSSRRYTASLSPSSHSSSVSLPTGVHGHYPSLASSAPSPPEQNEDVSTDDLLASLEHLLLHFAPRGLFRNLQAIAALVEGTTLNSTAQGKSFVRPSPTVEMY